MVFQSPHIGAYYYTEIGAQPIGFNAAHSLGLRAVSIGSSCGDIPHFRGLSHAPSV